MHTKNLSENYSGVAPLCRVLQLKPLSGRYFFVGGLRPPTKKYPSNRAFRRKSWAKTNFRIDSKCFVSIYRLRR